MLNHRAKKIKERGICPTHHPKTPGTPPSLRLPRPARISPIQPNQCIFLLRRPQMLPRQKHRPVNRNGQPPMPPPDHHRTQNQFTSRVPRAAEAVCLVRHADTNAYGAVSADDLENVVKDAEVDGVALEGAGLDYIDEEDGKDDPPKVVGELAAELLADEVASAFAGALLLLCGHSTLEAVNEARLYGGGGFFFAILGAE